MGSEADSAGARAGAVRCKARRTDASSTPGRTIVRNGTDDEDFEDTPELASSKRREAFLFFSKKSEELGRRLGARERFLRRQLTKRCRNRAKASC